ncbi:MAG: ABC transporter ATP-binding protein [Clostridiales bacterium]|nr:ABC transporter ATP-binding protein [Candidatus Blautia equi]
MFSGLASVSAILSPFFIGKAIDQIDTGNKAYYFLALLAGVYLCDWFSRFMQQYLMAGLGQRVVAHIRKVLFEKMKKLPLAYFDQNTHGDLMSRLTNDVDNISTTISDSLSQLLMLGFTIVGVLSIMLSLNVVLTLISLVSVVLVFLLTKAITGQTRKMFRRQQEFLGRMNGEIEEGISGLSMVKAYGREEAMYQRFERENEELRRVGTMALIWSGFLMPLMNVINNLSFLSVAAVSGIMAAKGLIPLSMVSSFVLYSRQLSRPFSDIANIYNTFQTAVAGAERIFVIFDEESEPADSEDAVPCDKFEGNLTFKNVSFGYTPERLILDGLNLEVKAGTKVAIVGETGAGKTTIINLLPRFYDVADGQVLLDGKDIRDYRRRDLRDAFGIVLQDTALFHMSVHDNICYGHPEATREMVEDAAKAAGAHEMICRLPKGYDTVLGGGGNVLSQGERQLITIARAMLADAPILILDEATSSVDTVTEQKIRRAMLAMTEGRTSFIIAHRLSTIRDSNLIILLDRGKIKEMGTHEELMAKNGQYAGLYRTQTG